MMKSYELIIPEMIRSKDSWIKEGLNQAGYYTVDDIEINCIIRDDIYGKTLCGQSWTFKDIPSAWLRLIGPIDTETLVINAFEAQQILPKSHVNTANFTLKELRLFAEKIENNHDFRNKTLNQNKIKNSASTTTRAWDKCR